MRNIDSYLDGKLKSNQQTPANKADPKMNIMVSRARTTVMDSDYWTVETIREKSGLGEVSVTPRRDRPYGSPNRIYEIHIDNGMVGTAIREYPDTFEEGWKSQFVIGTGVSVAIAFDGYWSRFRKLWRLVTEEKPWIFWVDNNNILWGQLWDDESTLVQLDTDVVKVRAMRAWKNVNIAANDQGIVVGYIKIDGSVWYRNYCQQADYSSVWETSKQLVQFLEIAININLFITNDYRMGFIIEDNAGAIHWLITPRNWAGMAIEHDIISVKAKANSDFIKVRYNNAFDDEIITVSASAISSMLFGRTDNTTVELENIPTTRINEDLEEYQDWGFIVKVRLNFESINIPTFSITDATTLSSFTISNVIEVEQGYEYNLLIDDTVHEFGLNDVEGDINLEVTNFANEAGYSYDTIDISFTPTNLVHSVIALPEVEVIWNE